ncbi:MAG: tetratricopeptide repeat protein [Planctomycetota bacterium]
MRVPSRASALLLFMACATRVESTIPELRLSSGKAIQAEIRISDPIVSTRGLEGLGGPVRGRSVRLRILEDGIYRLELRSYFFDAYLVLRNGEGAVLAEDNDGLLGTHSRLTRKLSSEHSYRLEVCALVGGTGLFELRCLRGRPRAWTGHERAEAELRNARLAVEARERLLGSTHPRTVESLAELAGLERGRDSARAAGLYRRVLEIRRQTLGMEHPETAAALLALGRLLESLGRHGEALALLRRALSIRRKVFGQEHPLFIECLEELGRAWVRSGKYAQAEPVLRKVLGLREKTLGSEHELTATALVNLGRLEHRRGALEDAELLLRKALELRERLFGTDDPRSAESFEFLAELLASQGKPDEAEAGFRLAVLIFEEVLGREHERTAASLLKLAEFLESRGKKGQAAELFRRVRNIGSKLLRDRR